MSFDLEEALRRYPLPEDVTDEVVNRGQCAKALGVSEPIVSKYLDQGLPVLERGSNGTAYAFQLSHVYAWKMQRDAARQAKQDAGDRAAAQLSLMFRGEDEDEADSGPVLTADQIIKESKADYERNKAAELRRELVRTAAVREAFEEMLITVRTQVITLVDFAEMEFGLTADQVAKMQQRCDGALVQMRQQMVQVCPAEVVNLRPHRPLDDDTARSQG